MPDEVDYFKVPEWLEDHPALSERGIVPVCPLKLHGVYETDRHVDQGFAIKVVDPATDEVKIYELLQRNAAEPRNHTIPCEVVGSDQSLLLMPRLWMLDVLFLPEHDPRTLLNIFDQIAEGIEYMHDLRIAHMDIAFGNVLIAGASHEESDKRVKADRVYIVDFDLSQRFDHGPGIQHVIPLPRTQTTPPDGVKYFDPFAWDVFCMGSLFKLLLETEYYHSPPPRMLCRFVEWVIGRERGCVSCCHCRPTVRGVRQTLSILQSIFAAGE